MSDILEPSEKQTNNRGGRLFQPGVSGNPHGRPKKEKCFSDIARQLLAAKKIDIEYTFPSGGVMKTAKVHLESTKTIYHGLIAALVKEGMDGNVQAIKELIDRTEGKAQEHIDHTTKGKELAQPIFQLIDTKTKEMCEQLVAGSGRESQKADEAAPMPNEK